MEDISRRLSKFGGLRIFRVQAHPKSSVLESTGSTVLWDRQPEELACLSFFCVSIAEVMNISEWWAAFFVDGSLESRVFDSRVQSSFQIEEHFIGLLHLLMDTSRHDAVASERPRGSQHVAREVENMVWGNTRSAWQCLKVLMWTSRASELSQPRLWAWQIYDTQSRYIHGCTFHDYRDIILADEEPLILAISSLVAICLMTVAIRRYCISFWKM